MIIVYLVCIVFVGGVVYFYPRNPGQTPDDEEMCSVVSSAVPVHWGGYETVQFERVVVKPHKKQY